MNPQLLKQFLTACRDAKKIDALMPDLPANISARQIQIIDVVQTLTEKLGRVRVSDVSDYLNATKPSITRAIQELVDLSVIRKQVDTTDRRIYWIRLSALGAAYYHQYITSYHSYLSNLLASVSEKDIQITCQTIDLVAALMQSHEPDIKAFGQK